MVRRSPPTRDANAMQCHNPVLGRTIADLDICLVEPSRYFQMLVRTMILHMRVERVRVHDAPTAALHDLLVHPCNLILVDADLPPPVSVVRFVRALRHVTLQPLCHVPIIVTFSRPNERLVHDVLDSGVQAVLVKPFSASALKQRLERILIDGRTLVLDRDRFVLDGVRERLDASRRKVELPAVAAMFGPAGAGPANASLQAVIDSILFPEPAPAAARPSRRPIPLVSGAPATG
jgi:DNA-binding NarL/FixJ family response regulator